MPWRQHIAVCLLILGLGLPSGSPNAADWAGRFQALQDEFWLIVNSPPKVPGSIWAALDETQKDNVLEALSKDLMGFRDKQVAGAMAKQAQAKLDALRQKIAFEDKVQSRMANQLGVDRARSLSDIIDQNIPPNPKFDGKAMMGKYAKMARTAIQNNPKAFASYAGEISAGRYDRVIVEAPNWAAAAFGEMVSDTLQQLQLLDAQFVWKEMVLRAGAAKEVGILLAQGKYDKAFDATVVHYKAEVKKASRAALAKFLDTALAPGASGQDALFGGGANTVSIGQLYLAVIDAEIAFIDWSKNYLRKKYDGACLELYKSEYERLGGNIGDAYTAFADCIPNSKLSAFFQFYSDLQSMGLDQRATTIKYLEDVRRGVGYARSPERWVEHLVESRKKAVVAKLTPDLQEHDKAHKLVARQFFEGMGEYLRGLAANELNKSQWEKLEQEIRALEQQVDAAIEGAAADIARLKANYVGVEQACVSFDAAKAEAATILARGNALQAKVSALASRISILAGRQCPAATAAVPSAEIQSVAQKLGDDTRRARQLIGEACQAPDSIRSASDKGTGRDALDQALDKANAGKDLLARTQQQAARLQALLKQVPTQQQGEPLGQEIGALRGELDLFEQQLQSLSGAELVKVKAAMGAAVNRADALMGVSGPSTGFLGQTRPSKTAEPGSLSEAEIQSIRAANTIHSRIVTTLKPFEKAPAARRAHDLLRQVQQSADSAVSCHDRLRTSWHEGDGDSRGSDGRARPWSRASIDVNPPLHVLRNDLNALIARCPEVDIAEPVEIDPALSARLASLADGDQRLDRCVAMATLVYRDRWLQQQDPAGPGRALAALEACDIETFQSELANLPQGSAARRQALDAFNSERAARDSFEQGRVLLTNGDIDSARSRFATARTQARCNSTLQAVDSALALAENTGSVVADTSHIDAALAACHLTEAKAEIDKLAPDSADSGRLSARLEEIVRSERGARSRYGEARSALAAGDLDTAQDRLQTALSSAACDQTRAAIEATNAELARQRHANDRAVAARGDAAINACRFDEAESHLAQIKDEAVQRMLSQRLREARAREQEATAHYSEGRRHYGEGRFATALQSMEAARAASNCPATIASVDAATGAINTQIAQRQDSESRLAQSGIAALRACDVASAEAILGQLSANGAARAELAASIEAERTAGQHLQLGIGEFERSAYSTAMASFRNARASSHCPTTRQRAEQALAQAQSARLAQIERENEIASQRAAEEERIAIENQRVFEERQRRADAAAARQRQTNQQGRAALAESLIGILGAMNGRRANRPAPTHPNDIFENYREPEEQRRVMEALGMRPSSRSSGGGSATNSGTQSASTSSRCAELTRQLLASFEDWKVVTRSMDGKRWASKRDPGYVAAWREVQRRHSRMTQLNAEKQRACGR